MPNNPNLFIHILLLNDDEIKCTFVPLIRPEQIPNDATGCNIWPFIPLKAQLKHHFYPMLHRFDFEGELKIQMHDIPCMKLMLDWIKDKSGHPTAIQFFINRRKTVREEAGLIYYNAGSLETVPDEAIFNDLEDTEYHNIGNLYWRLWNNLPWEMPRSTRDNFLKIIEPSPIKKGVRRMGYRITKAEDDFVSACMVPSNWANESNITNNSLPEMAVIENSEVIEEWQEIVREKQDLQFKPVKLPVMQWRCNVEKDTAEKIDLISNAIEKLDCAQDNRISKNTKVTQYESALKKEAVKVLKQLKDFQEEKQFYNLNARDNEKLYNEYYLPQIHFVLAKQYRYGQKSMEVEETGTQYEDVTEMVDWSGQWSSDIEE